MKNPFGSVHFETKPSLLTTVTTCSVIGASCYGGWKTSELATDMVARAVTPKKTFFEKIKEGVCNNTGTAVTMASSSVAGFAAIFGLSKLFGSTKPEYQGLSKESIEVLEKYRKEESLDKSRPK